MSSSVFFNRINKTTVDIKKILQFEFKSKKIKTIQAEDVLNEIKSGWFKYYQKVFIVVFVLTIAGGGYIWYSSLYNSQWSEFQKQQYIDSQQKKESFNENNFKEIIKVIDDRKNIYEGESMEVKDIFKPSK